MTDRHTNELLYALIVPLPTEAYATDNMITVRLQWLSTEALQ